jgi:hypothetical protein
MSGTEVTTEATVDVTDDLDAFATEFFGGTKVAEPDAKPGAEQEQGAETESESTEAQSGELTDQDESEAEIELAKPKSKVQERIDELVRQREEIKRESDRQLEAMRKEFEDKLAALKPAEVKTPTSEEPSPDALNADGSPKYALGEFDPSYIRDLTRFTLEQERTAANARAVEERKVQEQNIRAQQLQESWTTKVESAKERYPDLVEKGQVLLNGFADLPPDYANYLATVLQSMDHGPDVLYYLSSNPSEARTIVNSGAQKATLALGRIEAKFIEAEAQKLVAKPKISKAPPPPSATARGTGGAAPSVAPDTDDLEAFEREFFKSKRK